MGINRCTKQLLLFGPTSPGAIGFTNTWTDQGIAQVQLLMGHLRQQGEIGQLTIILLEILQLDIGSVLPLFSYPLSQVLKYCQRTWLLNVWDFLVSIEGTMHLEHKWNLAIQQTHDVFLMDAIMNHTPHFPPKVLKQMNACPIFLQVLSLADISDGSGYEILKGSLQGIQHNDRRSSYDWPKQLCPSAGAWRTWQSTLQALFCVTSKSTRLRQTLGPWQHGGPKHQQWSYNVDPSTMCLVHCAELAGIFWCFHPAHSPRLFHSTPSILFARPSKLIPVTVARSTQQFLELTAHPMLAQEYEQNTSHPTNPVVATSIMQHIQDLPMVLHNTLGHCYSP
jgi:hypothetical protein